MGSAAPTTGLMVTAKPCLVGLVLVLLARVVEPLTLESHGSGQTCGTPSSSLAIKPAADVALRRFAENQRAMLAGPPEKMRFVVHGAVHNAGLGNQIQAFTSALLLAMLTNRGLLVDWPVVDPHDIVYAGNNKSELAGLPQVEQLFRVPGFDWDFWRVMKLIPQEMLVRQVAMVEVSNRFPDVMEKIMCEDLDEALPMKVISMKAWDTYVPLLMLNPHYKEKVLNTFGMSPFRPLSNFVLRPVESIEQSAAQFAKQHFEGKFVIGVQVRSFFMHKSQLSVFWKCAKLLAHIHTERTKQRVVFFLATDNNAVRELAENALGKRFMVHTGLNITRSSQDGIKSAMLDLLLLERADELINTAGSSFGRVAAARSGRLAHVVTTSDTCLRQVLSEPCTRLWDLARNFTCVDGKQRSSPLMLNHHDCHDTW